MVTCQVSTNLRCAIIAVIFVVSNNRPVSIYNSSTIFCGQFRNWDWPFHAISFSKKIYTTEAAMEDKIPFYALDLRNISRLVKTKTKTRAQCLMVNTGSLIRSFSINDGTTKTLTSQIKNLIGRVRKNNRAACAARTYEQVRAVLCKTTTWNYHIYSFGDNDEHTKIFNSVYLI